MTEELDRLGTVMQRFADEELQGSSPLYEQLARAAAQDTSLLEPLLAAPKSQRKATLYFAAIHYLIRNDPRDDLAAFFPDVEGPTVNEGPVPALRSFLATHKTDLETLYRSRNTQTNEVGRSAFLIPMFGLVQARAGKPLAMIEAGASAGLNLLFDKYFMDYGEAGSFGDPSSRVRLEPEIRGEISPPVPRGIEIASRTGVDVQPVDVNDDAQIAWLRACIWPEHTARAELFERAVEIARADPPKIVQGNILEIVSELISAVPRGTPVCVFHTAALAYLHRDERTRFGELMAEAGRSREVYWVAGEGPHILASLFPEAAVSGPDNGYGLVVSRAGRDASWVGSAAYHGRWLAWR